MLDKKYVLHIPLNKFVSGSLVNLEIDDILEDLLFNFEGCYMANVKSRWKNRTYDELLITVFSTKEVDKIFKKWFLKNNNVLCQEAFAYEIGDVMYIEEL